MNRFDYAGKSVVITGAATGIGRQTARRFAAAGARLTLADVNREDGEVLAAELGAGFLACDVSREDEVATLVATALDRHGAIDAAFNNAGIAPMGEPIWQMPLAMFEKVLAVNLTGVFLCTRYVAAAMRDRGGAIVNTSSVMGQVSGPGLAAYSASKAGVIALTRAAAIDLAPHGVTVNALCPGGIGGTGITEAEINQGPMEQLRMMTPMQKLGVPDDIADAVLWLCSPGARYLTGQALTIDGGFSSW